MSWDDPSSDPIGDLRRMVEDWLNEEPRPPCGYSDENPHVTDASALRRGYGVCVSCGSLVETKPGALDELAARIREA